MLMTLNVTTLTLARKLLYIKNGALPLKVDMPLGCVFSAL